MGGAGGWESLGRHAGHSKSPRRRPVSWKITFIWRHFPSSGQSAFFSAIAGVRLLRWWVEV